MLKKFKGGLERAEKGDFDMADGNKGRLIDGCVVILRLVNKFESNLRKFGSLNFY